MQLSRHDAQYEERGVKLHRGVVPEVIRLSLCNGYSVSIFEAATPIFKSSHTWRYDCLLCAFAIHMIRLPTQPHFTSQSDHRLSMALRVQ
jgi:hypothetical protein